MNIKEIGKTKITMTHAGLFIVGLLFVDSFFNTGNWAATKIFHSTELGYSFTGALDLILLFLIWGIITRKNNGESYLLYAIVEVIDLAIIAASNYFALMDRYVTQDMIGQAEAFGNGAVYYTTEWLQNNIAMSNWVGVIYGSGISLMIVVMLAIVRDDQLFNKKKTQQSEPKPTWIDVSFAGVLQKKLIEKWDIDNNKQKEAPNEG